MFGLFLFFLKFPKMSNALNIVAIILSVVHSATLVEYFAALSNLWTWMLAFSRVRL